MQMQDVVDAYLAAKTEDNSVSSVYRKVIRPRFRISRTTLYAYLNTPIKKQLKELEGNEK
jgi:hypothetical protein